MTTDYITNDHPGTLTFTRTSAAFATVFWEFASLARLAENIHTRETGPATGRNFLFRTIAAAASCLWGLSKTGKHRSHFVNAYLIAQWNDKCFRSHEVRLFGIKQFGKFILTNINAALLLRRRLSHHVRSICNYSCDKSFAYIKTTVKWKWLANVYPVTRIQTPMI